MCSLSSKCWWHPQNSPLCLPETDRKCIKAITHLEPTVDIPRKPRSVTQNVAKKLASCSCRRIHSNWAAVCFFGTWEMMGCLVLLNLTRRKVKNLSAFQVNMPFVYTQSYTVYYTVCLYIYIHDYVYYMIACVYAINIYTELYTVIMYLISSKEV